MRLKIDTENGVCTTTNVAPVNLISILISIFITQQSKPNPKEDLHF